MKTSTTNLFLLILIVNGDYLNLQNMIPVTKTKDKEEIKVKNEFKQGIDYEENIWKPIRMKYAFSDDVNESDKDYLSNLGDILASYFSRFIYIQRAYEDLIMTLDSCYDVAVPQFMQENYYKYDFLFLFHTYDDIQEQYTSWSLPCIELIDNNRPVLMAIKINKAYFKLNNNEVDFDKNLHDLMYHILSSMVLNEMYFDKFFDSQNNQNYDEVLKTDSNGYEILVTPQLVQAVRDHFDCQTIEGLKLENQKTPGYKFESLQFFDDMFQTYSKHEGRVLSIFVFKLMEDSGWYRVQDMDYEQSIWGYKKGCDFYENACNSSTQYKEFCTPQSEENVIQIIKQFQQKSSCTYGNQAISLCTSDYGGHDTTESCGVEMGLGAYVCKQESNDLRDELIELIEGAHMSFGYNSKCFEGTFQDPNNQYDLLNSSCHKYQCSVDKKRVILNINGIDYICDQNGKVLSPQEDTLSGQIHCPEDIEEFCNLPLECKQSCNYKGICQNGKCLCKDGYYGDTCEKQCDQFYYNGSCYDKCPDNTFSYDQIRCFSCPDFCLNCSDIGSCLECKGGYQIKDGFCYQNPNTKIEENKKEEILISNNLEYFEIQDKYAQLFIKWVAIIMLCLNL